MDELSLGDRELDVMAVLWELGDGTVAEVRDKLPADLAYTTVLTILRKLETKGLVRHKGARRTVLGRLIDKLFDGSPEQLLAHLVDDHALTPAQVKRIRERLAAAAKRGGGRSSGSATATG